MTSLQLCFGFLIFLLMIIKPIAYKPCIQYFPSKLSANFTSVWLLIGIVFSWPFFGHLFTDNWQQICSSPYTLFSILKGILLYAMIVYQQEVNKNSTSSSVFFWIYCHSFRFSHNQHFLQRRSVYITNCVHMCSRSVRRHILCLWRCQTTFLTR